MATYILPANPDALVDDPLSICGNYESLQVKHWTMIEKVLSVGIDGPLALIDCITNFNLEAECMDTLLDATTSFGQEQFFKSTLPSILKAALSMPELFPEGELKVLKAGIEDEVSLTREKIACLLSHMFLCTLRKPEWNRHWADFHIWYGSTSTPVLAYLHTLLVYFAQLDSGKPEHPQELVTFHRRVLGSPPDWKNSQCLMSQITPSQELIPSVAVEVQFANRDIGFGVSGSQEEVNIAMSPETCVVMLLVPTLQDNEALLIRGARRVGIHAGTGRNVVFVEPCLKSFDWSTRCIVAIDALELDCIDSACPVKECQADNLTRELNKAYCGFSPSPLPVGGGNPNFSSIATGHWGCGAFGGHRYAKALIQVMAAAMARTNLVFHDIQGALDRDPVFMHSLQDFISFLVQQEITVGMLFGSMVKAGEKLCQSQPNLNLLQTIELLLSQLD